MKINFREITNEEKDFGYPDIPENIAIIKKGKIRELQYIKIENWLNHNRTPINRIVNLDFNICRLYKQIKVYNYKYKFKIVFKLQKYDSLNETEDWNIIVKMSLLQYYWINLCNSKYWITQKWFWKIIISSIIGFIVGFILSKMLSCN